MKRQAFVYLLLAVLCAGCIRKEDGPESGNAPGFSIEELTLTAGSAMRSFDVYADGQWSLEAPQWVTCSPDCGNGDATVSVIVSANQGDIRTGEVVLSNGGKVAVLPVVQEATAMNKAPSVPELLYPAEGMSDIPVNVSFRWTESTDPEGDDFSYDLLVSLDGGKTWISTITSATEAKCRQLLEKSHECLWKVRVVDEYGREAVSEAVSFMTGDIGGMLDGEVYEWQHESAGAPEPVHIVFTGDGFVPADWAEDGIFMKEVGKYIETIFEVEPYRTYRDYFRISIVAAHSVDSGATIEKDMGYLGPDAQKKNTVFKSTLAGGGETYIGGDDDMVKEYAKKVPGIETKDDLNNTTVFVLVNVDAYAGTCHAYSRGFSACFCPLGTMSVNGQLAYKSIIVHEGAGHGFGCLQDEYVYYNEPVDEYSRQSYELFREHNYLSSWNVSLTGDPEQVHWKHYFDRPGYESVGMYEGAMLYAYGVWRPEEASCMGDNRPYFNAPSREAIVRRICDISGVEFDMDAFIEKDVVKSDPTGLPANVETRAPQQYFPPLAPPVYIVED